MPQTLLALLALMLASFLTLNQQQLTTRSRAQMSSDEVELAAVGLASEVFAMIDGRSFDENSSPAAIGANDGEIPASGSDFKTPDTFGEDDRGDDGCDLRPAETPECDDVDDLHGGGWRPATIELARQYLYDPYTLEPVLDSVRVREMDFEVRTQVYYVADPESMEPAGTRTLHKRVLVDIRSALMPDLPEGIYRGTRVISYDPVKAEMDYENSEYYDPTYGAGGATNETPGGTTNESGN